MKMIKLRVTMYNFNDYYREGKIDIEKIINFRGKIDVQGIDLLAYYRKDKEKEIKLISKLLQDNNLTLALIRK